jgi:hypothetical protein
VPAEQVEKSRFGIDGLEAVQQQDGAACASPHYFEFGPQDPEPLAI